MSFCGSFVNIRGGNQYPELIRVTPPKPIRVFLQSGENDLNMPAYGNWALANKQMASALTEMRYDHWFVFGTDGHDDKHGGAILPDALRWLWRDYKAA